MPDSFIQWIALIGMVAIGVVFVAELRKWRAIDSLIGRRQRVLRVWLILLIEALFVMMLIGPLVTSRSDSLGQLLYWTICLVMGLAVVALALLDLREVARQYLQQTRTMFRDLRGDDERK